MAINCSQCGYSCPDDTNFCPVCGSQITQTANHTPRHLGIGAIVLGVGLGTTETAKKLLEWTLEAANVPIVLDADGLNILSADKNLWKKVPLPFQ